MIVTFTDFGTEGPYLGQMRAAALAMAPGTDVVDLMSDAPVFDIRASAYLLPAVIEPIAPPCVCLGVVDPGVGGARRPVVLKADGRWFVGPDNGLFAIVARRAREVDWYEIAWRPQRLSASFHGRDLFAPVAGMIAAGDDGAMPGWGRRMTRPAVDGSDWPADLSEVVYVDRYGNCMTGIRAGSLETGAELRTGDISLPRVRTFSDVSHGVSFCYENALGLMEISVNQGDAAQRLRLRPGSQVSVRNV